MKRIFTSELLQFIETTPPKLKEYYIIYLTVILSRMINTDSAEYITQEAFALVNFNTFHQKGIPKNHIKTIQLHLEQEGVITVNHSYVSANLRSKFTDGNTTHPKSYRIEYSYLQTPAMIDSIKYINTKKQHVTDPTLKGYYQSLNQLKFKMSIDKLFKIEKKENVLVDVDNDYYNLRYNLHLYYNLYQFENVKSYSKCSAGRLHNRLTRLMKKLRKYIKGFDSMVMLDVSNCQMFLLACLMIKNKIINKEYFHLVTSGQFKEYIHQQYQQSNKCNWYSLEQTKSDINTYFFGRESTHTFLKEIMKSKFNNVHEYLMEMKKEDYKNSSTLLQKTEANMMVNNVLTRCKEEGIKAYLIHDAIIVPVEQEQEVVNIMLFEFWSEFELEPDLKSERF